MNNINFDDIEVLEIEDEFCFNVDSVPKPPVSIKDIYQKNRNNNSGKIKLMMILLILVLTLFIGLGLFFFLRYAKENINNQFKLEEKTVELGTNSKDIKLDNKKCKMNTEKVDFNSVGKYDYSVNCDGKVYKSKINVVDTTAPQISLKTVNIEKNDIFEASDFILTSYDLSDITFEFEKDFDITKVNTENGIYPILVNAKDEYGNVTKDYAIVYVTNIKAEKYLVSTKLSDTKYDATLNVMDNTGFNSVNYYVNSFRVYEYIFNSKEEYELLKSESLKTGEIEGIAGKIVCNDDNLNIKLIKITTREELNVLNGSFPATYNDISAMYHKLEYKNRVINK